MAPRQRIAARAAALGKSASRIPGHGFLGIGLAIAVALGGLSSIQATDPGSPSAAAPTSTPTANDIEASIRRSTLGGRAFPGHAPGPTGRTTEAKVVSVVDGDTIVVAVSGREYTVSYIGMDTPETVDPSSPVEWMGVQASARIRRSSAAGRSSSRRTFPTPTADGQLLRYVWLTDDPTWTLVNLELVRQGLVSIANFAPDVKYAAKHEAQATATGLWGETRPTAKPTHSATPRATPKPKPAKPTSRPAAKPRPASKCQPSAPLKIIGPDGYRLDRDDSSGCE